MALSRLKALVASQAVKKFTDRENSRDAFDNSFRGYLAGEIPFKVLTYYGVGGIGKTSLLKELRKFANQLSEKELLDLCIISLDFDSDHIGSAADALYAFRMQWLGDCPLFEFALAKYWAIQGRTIDQIRKQVIREDSLLFDLIEAGSSLADVFAPAKLVKKLYSKGSDLLHRHGNLADRFDQIESLTEAELAEWLPALLGEEIDKWVTTTDKRLLVFIDSHERLFTDGRYKLGKLCGDEWLQELLGSAGKGFYVICGRNYINWTDHNAEWEPYLEQHVLGKLTNEDADAFLQGIPVTEDNVRETIVAASHGVPLYLDLCASTYVLKKQTGDPIIEEDFQGAGGHVIDRFLNCLDREQAETVRALSGLECFDKRAFAAVTKALNIGLPVTLFDEFCTASYAEFLQSSSKLAKIHDIVRAYLRPSIRSDDLERIVLAVVIEAQTSKSEADYPRVSWLLRSILPILTLSSLNIGTGASSEIVVLCLDMADAGYVDEAVVIGDGFRLSSNRSVISIFGDVIHAHCLRRTGRLKEAQTRYTSIKDEMHIDPLQELNLRVRYQAAHVDHLLGDYTSSKRLYEMIVATYEQYPADQEARYLAKRQLGDLSMLEGKFSQALQIFNECVSLRQSDRLWHLECSRFIGHVYRFNWMLPEAEKHYVEIAAQSKAYGLRGMHGKALVNLTETYWWTNPWKALEVGRDAVEANEASGNLIEVGKALTAMALAELILGNVSKAMEHLEQAKETQKSVGYSAGLIFVEGAMAYCWFVMGKDDDVSQCLGRSAQGTDSLGVYKYLNWFYRAVCAAKDISYDTGPYDWLNKPRLSDSILSLSAHLSQLRSNH